MSGLPGSGKSTEAVRLMKRGWTYTGLDVLRGGGRTKVWPKLEGWSDWEHSCHNMQALILEMALRAPDVTDIVVDNTHLFQEQIDGLCDGIWALRETYPHIPVPEFIVHDLTHVPLEECMARNALRDDWLHPECILYLHRRHQEAVADGWRLTPELLDWAVRT